MKQQHQKKKSGTNKPETSSATSADAPQRRLPVGAEVQENGGVHFRVWAPRSRQVAVVRISANGKTATENLTRLTPETNGYFSGFMPDAAPGMLYKYRLDSGDFPDPISRFQPEGPHGPSQVIDPGRFHWTDQEWKGVSREGQVIYELHIGTFTPEGTWKSAMNRLPHLLECGITVVEVMPVADFPGRFGWGYDGVDLFAPTRLYGTPEDFRTFVNRAHELGLGVILDVVYNHFGPDGNYLKQFSNDYTTEKHRNDWGEGINFDGENNGPVREFFISNAAYWVDEFHLDGLRLDATQQIFDESKEHVLTALNRRLQDAAKGRSTFVVAENEDQQSRLLRSPQHGGNGLDAAWNDDFHHSAIVALAGRNEAYYSDYRGAPQEFISAVKHGYLFQGQWYVWQKKRRGMPAFGTYPSRFVTFLENHDQVANSLRGLRVHQFTGNGQYKALTALLLLGPNTPMLFQGQEFAASAPFLFFADHNPELAKLVRKGRRGFLSQFPSVAALDDESLFVNPDAESTFQKCKLDWSELDRNSATYALHRDLLKLRKEDAVFSRPRPLGVDGAVLGPDAFVLRFFGAETGDRLLLINLGVDQHLNPAPEPLLSPMEGTDWKLEWSSEDPRYGGSGTPPLETEKEWLIPGHAAVVLFPGKLKR